MVSDIGFFFSIGLFIGWWAEDAIEMLITLSTTRTVMESNIPPLHGKKF